MEQTFDIPRDEDRRVRRTKDAIQSAFSEMMLSDEFDRIRIADVLRAADVARSTFYQHFTGKDDLLCSVMAPILDPLARAGSEPDPSPYLVRVAEHLWQNRRLGPVIFLGSTRTAIVRNLARRLEPILQDTRPPSRLPVAYVASVIAQWQVASLEEWLTGRHRCDAVTWAQALCRGTGGLATALTSDHDAGSAVHLSQGDDA